eukprot:6594494-Prymnesium_polylepis.1
MYQLASCIFWSAPRPVRAPVCAGTHILGCVIELLFLIDSHRHPPTRILGKRAASTSSMEGPHVHI